jgi:hypothetical protein
MPIQFVAGDLFANRFGAWALAHGCNCQGSMGAGIATGFRDRYPAMYAEYRRRCKAQPHQFNLGDAFLWKADDQPWVFNLATQEGTWRARASYSPEAGGPKPTRFPPPPDRCPVLRGRGSRTGQVNDLTSAGRPLAAGALEPG